jgi:hypothetical protein
VPLNPARTDPFPDAFAATRWFRLPYSPRPLATSHALVPTTKPVEGTAVWTYTMSLGPALRLTPKLDESAVSETTELFSTVTPTVPPSCQPPSAVRHVSRKDTPSPESTMGIAAAALPRA